FGEPEGGLDRLRAAREQLGMGDSLREQPGDQIEKTGAVLSREAAEGDAIELLLETLDVVRMAMAETADRDAGDEVEILVAVDVGDRAAAGAVDHDLRIERDRLQPRRHSLGLAVEYRLGSGARHGAASSCVGRRRGDGPGRGFVHFNQLLAEATKRGRRWKRSIRQSAIACAASSR